MADALHHPDLQIGVLYADHSDPLSSVIPLADAPAAVSVTRRTINRWIAAKRLRVITPPGTTGRYVIKRELLACERDRHLASHQGRPGARVRLDALT
ncbi:hypothetical protein [Actinomadura rudentiformis]|uniref:Helix-turn-helix domain-containing protein n=1 Tax=Actinomadura rudentiformis TaxID=359158 RepID=A0A6H9Z249_9ACTN|nr:hypothetical protein [Actinomadura rudentiformis]KAB2347337.1 hypothetical protein F8566_20205 [Actinomadura rudentiformis]